MEEKIEEQQIEQFLVVPRSIIQNKELTIADRWVLARAFSFKEFFESPQNTADFLGLSVSAVQKSKQKLESLGYLIVIEDAGHGKRYKCDMEKVMNGTPKEPKERTQRSKDIDEAFDIWQEVLGTPLIKSNNKDRFALNSMLNRKDFDLEKLRYALMLVRESEKDKYKRFAIVDFQSLQRHYNELIAWARSKRTQQVERKKKTLIDLGGGEDE